MPQSTPPKLQDFLTEQQLTHLINLAKVEDMGPEDCDITSSLFVPESLQATASIGARQEGRLAGAALVPQILAAYDSRLTYTPNLHDSQSVSPGQSVGIIQGPLQSLLSAERVVLNFMTHLSGIASLTAQYVAAVQGSKSGIYDTRKTIPGLRGLHKYAVACGGGRNHRIGLYDAVLVKDNHIAHTPSTQLGDALASAIAKARTLKPAPSFIEVEVDTLVQLEAILKASPGPDMVLLDNMSNVELVAAVVLRDKFAPNVELEASGGVNLSTVTEIAQTGVDRIAVGALTHSAPSLDLGLDITPA